MKKYFLIFAIITFELIVLIGASCSSKSTNGSKKQYEKFIEMFDDSTFYAIVKVDGQELLFISNETYQNENTSHKTITTAIAAQIYGVDSAGKIVPYGEVRSQGTLYPISISDEYIVTAGHHFIEKYLVKESLELKEDASVSYSTDGNATYDYENRNTNEFLNNCSEEKFDSLMNIVSTPVEFLNVKDIK